MRPPRAEGAGLAAVEGCLTRLGSLLVIRAGWSTALPIPIAIEAPDGARLAAWALRLSEAGARPECLLMISGPEPPGAVSDWTVGTHFGPVPLRARTVDRGGGLPPEDAPAVLLALLRATAPDTLDAVTDALAALPEALDALRARGPHVPGRTMAGGRLRIGQPLDFVPAHAVVRAGPSPRLVRVGTVDIVFDDRESTQVGLDAAEVPRVDEVLFLIGDRRVVAVREGGGDG